MDGRYSEALERQLELIRYWNSDRGLRAGEALRQSLLPVLGATPSPDHIRRMRALEVEDGETYYVSGELAAVIKQAADVLPAGSVLDLATLPSFAGWVYLGRGLPLPIPLQLPTEDAIPWHWNHLEQGGAVWLRGMSWCVGVGGIEPDDPRRHWTSADVIANANEISATYYIEDPSTGRLELHSSMAWPAGQPWDQWNQKIDPVVTEEYEGFKACRGFLLAFFAFVQQRILAYREQRADRPTRRRLAPYMNTEPVIRVIELRRREYARHTTDERRDMEWSCQWITRGHWHRYHTRDGLQPRWVAPYIKGDPTKPLKTPRADVFAVVR